MRGELTRSSPQPTAGSRLRRLVAGAAAALLLGGAVALGAAAPASAHDFLISTSPAADATVTDALTSVSLTFNEPPFAEAGAAIAIRVTDPAGEVVSDGSVSITDATLSTGVAPTTAGSYQVLWQNVSGDGHTVSGEFAFTYAGPVGGGAVATAPATPGSGAAGTEPTASAQPVVTPSTTGAVTAAPTATAGAGAGGSSSSSGGFPGVLVGVITAGAIVVLAAIVVVALLVSRRRGPAAAPAAEDRADGPTDRPPDG